MTDDQYTLGQLARIAGLARSSVLHYEALGLLTPASRSAAGYRHYGGLELERLRAIRRFREAGLTLAEVGALLAPPRTPCAGPAAPAALLEARLVELCKATQQLREQQMLLARLLASSEFRAGRQHRDKADWVALLRGAGFSEADMQRWHVEYERESPTGHAEFLRSLGLSRQEVLAIQRWSRTGSVQSDPKPSPT